MAKANGLLGRVAWRTGALLAATLCLAATAMSWTPLRQTREAAAHDAKWRAEQVAVKLAQRVSHAIAVGIPVDQLTGVEDLFRSQLQALPELQALQLRQASGQVLAQAQRAPAGVMALRHASVAAPVTASAGLAVTVEYQQTGAFTDAVGWTSLWAWMLPLLTAASLGGLVGAALAARAWSVGWLRRDNWLRQLAADPALNTDTPPTQALPVLPRREHDLRPNWLADQLRRWRESHEQWVRIAQSLRKTEADPAKRLWLEEQLQALNANTKPANEGFAQVLQAPAAGAWRRAKVLQVRVAVLLLISVLVLAALAAGGVWQYTTSQTERYHGALEKSQALAFARLEIADTATLLAAVDTPAVQTEWAAASAARDVERMSRLLDGLAAGQPNRTAEVYDDQQRLVVTTSSALNPQALVDPPSLRVALADASSRQGQSRNRDGHYTVVLRPANGFTLVLGERWSGDLSSLKQALDADIALVNLRGRVVASTVSSLAGQEGFIEQARDAGVVLLPAVDSRPAWRAVVQPLEGLQGRPIGALVGLHDETRVQRAWRQQWLAWGLLLLVSLTALSVLVRWQLKRFMAPLEHAVDVLEGLAQGRTDLSPDEAEQAEPGEAGAVARGVAALRRELLNLAVLRGERLRARRQQERLIRGELTRLAANLDQASRQEVMSALRDEAPTATQEANELAGLAQVLGRLTDLVTGQQNRLLQVLADLRTAMAQQAQFLSLQQELQIAQRMQASILPRAALPLREVQMSSLMVPAKEVGGDFYDYFQPSQEQLAVVVADVSGKGVPAALFMAISRTLLKANALSGAQPSEVMTRLNDQLCSENEQMMFVTAFFALLNLRTGLLRYVNAGHNPPLLVHEAAITYLPRGENPALAVIDGVPYQAGQLQLTPGDALLLYTDGVTEATNAVGALMGEAALLTAMRDAMGQHLPLQNWPEHVLTAVRRFEAGAPQADDITCLALRYQPAATD